MDTCVTAEIKIKLLYYGYIKKNGYISRRYALFLWNLLSYQVLHGTLQYTKIVHF